MTLAGGETFVRYSAGVEYPMGGCGVFGMAAPGQ